jgi:hypothetical protein
MINILDCLKKMMFEISFAQEECTTHVIQVVHEAIRLRLAWVRTYVCLLGRSDHIRQKVHIYITF